MSSLTGIVAQPARKPLFWAVCFGHMTNDVFMAFGPVMITFAGVSFFNTSAAEIGVAISLRELISATSQPFFGYLSDRTGWGRILAAGGVAWSCLLMLLALAMAFSGSFWGMVIPAALAALGSGAFHPVGAMYATATDKKQAATNSSIFFWFGQTGLAIGPALAGIVMQALTFKEGATVLPIPLIASAPLLVYLMGVVAVPGVAGMAATIPSRKAIRAKAATATPESGTRNTLLIGALVLFVLYVILRSVAHIGVVNFIPLLFQRKGWESSAYGAITSLFWFASGVSGVVMGRLADRFDRRIIIAMSLVLAAPVLFVLPLTDGAIAFALAVASGALVGASFPLTVVLAQSLFPKAKGFASGAILGGLFAAGSLGGLVIGFLADGTKEPGGFQGIGLGTTFQLVAGVALIAAFLALRMPASMSGKQS